MKVSGNSCGVMICKFSIGVSISRVKKVMHVKIFPIVPSLYNALLYIVIDSSVIEKTLIGEFYKLAGLSLVKRIFCLHYKKLICLHAKNVGAYIKSGNLGG